MKKLLLAFITIHCSLITASAQSSWLWGAQATTNILSFGEGNAESVDGKGNVFTTGDFKNTMYFGNDSIGTFPGSLDAFLAKYDNTGTLLWVFQSNTPSSTSLCEALCLSQDRFGYSYIGGDYYDTAMFGPFMVKDQTASYSLDGMYLAKINQSGGILWVRQSKAVTKSSGGHINGVVTDKWGNIYITGELFGKVTFGSNTLNSSGNGCFLVKYDSAGNVLWARESSANFATEGNAISIGMNGDIYITGYFYGTATFGSYVLSSFYTHDMFTVKYDSAGNVIWAKQANLASAKCQMEGLGVTTDASGDAYVTGYVYDTAYIGTDTIHTVNDSDAFIAKYDSGGNNVWLIQANNKDNNDWLGYSICSDTLNNIYVSCGGWGAKEKNPNCELIWGTDTLKTDNSGFDNASTITKFNTDGTAVCGIITPSMGDDRNAVACDGNGKYIYLSGDLGTTATFGPDVLTFNYSEAPVVARWNPCSITGLNELVADNQQFKVYPNPSNGAFTLQVGSGQLAVNSKIEVYNMLEEVVYNGQFTMHNRQCKIDLSGQPAGVYMYRVITEAGKLLKADKLLIVH